MKRTLLFAVIALALIVPAGVFAEPGGETVVKVGDIVAMSGEVMVRTKGVWGTLTKVPHPLFSTDKIVTKKGRAEVRFVDGGSLRVNVDSNLSVTRLMEMKGFIAKKPVSSRQINVLVGDAWFDVKVTKDKQVTFKTPSMTAAIRGTSGKVGAKVDGSSSWGLATGNAKTEGKFEKVESPKPMSLADVITKNLPPSNPIVQKSPIMQAVVKAVEANLQAAQAASKADASTEVAKAAGDQAVKSQTGENVKVAAEKAVESAAIKAAAAVVEVQAQISNKEEALVEAKLLGTKADIKAVEQSIQADIQTLAMVEQKQAEVIKLAEAVKTEQNASKAIVVAAQAQTKAETAKANASVSVVQSQVAIAASTGNKEAIATAQAQVAATTATVALAEKQEVKAEQIVQLQQTATSVEQLAVAVVAASAITQASQTISASAQMQASVAVESTSGDTATLEIVTAVSAQTQQLATTVDTATNDVVTAVETNNLANVTEAAQTTSDASTYTDTTTNQYEETSPTQEIIPVVPQEPTTTTTSPSG